MADYGILRDARPYRRGDTGQTPGQPAPLPQGEASGLNDASQNIQPPPDLAAAMPDFSQLLTPAGPEYRPQKGTPEEFLFAPTSNPMQNVNDGTSAFMRMPPPKEAIRILPVLDAAASAPDAPPQLKALRDMVVYHLGEPI